MVEIYRCYQAELFGILGVIINVEQKKVGRFVAYYVHCDICFNFGPYIFCTVGI